MTTGPSRRIRGTVVPTRTASSGSMGCATRTGEWASVATFTALEPRSTATVIHPPLGVSTPSLVNRVTAGHDVAERWFTGHDLFSKSRSPTDRHSPIVSPLFQGNHKGAIRHGRGHHTS